jgi:hypothetical protein
MVQLHDAELNRARRFALRKGPGGAILPAQSGLVMELIAVVSAWNRHEHH